MLSAASGQLRDSEETTSTSLLRKTRSKLVLIAILGNLKLPFVLNKQFRIYLKHKFTDNLGQNKWNIWTTPPPPPHFNDAKMARFCFFAPSSLLWGGGRGV